MSLIEKNLADEPGSLQTRDSGFVPLFLVRAVLDVLQDYDGGANKTEFKF